MGCDVIPGARRIEGSDFCAVPTSEGSDTVRDDGTVLKGTHAGGHYKLTGPDQGHLIPDGTLPASKAALFVPRVSAASSASAVTFSPEQVDALTAAAANREGVEGSSGWVGTALELVLVGGMGIGGWIQVGQAVGPTFMRWLAARAATAAVTAPTATQATVTTAESTAGEGVAARLLATAAGIAEGASSLVTVLIFIDPTQTVPEA